MERIKLGTLLAGIAFASVLANAADFSPYGYVRFNGEWSDSATDENASRFNYGVSQSVLGINIRDSIYEGRLVLTGKLEGDFVDNYNLKLNQGFVNFSFPKIGLDILLGQTWALFVPYDPPTINYQNFVGAGNLAKELPQIRITQKLGIAEVAAATHKYGERHAFEGRIGTATAIKIGASAFWVSEDDEPATWGVAADACAPLGIASLSGEFFAGRNLSHYGGISEPYYRNVAFGVKSVGGWGALGIKASDNLSFNAGAGAEKIASTPYWPSALWFNRAIFANINYKLGQATTLALEYYRYDSEYMDKTKDGYNRVETAVTFEF